MMDSNSQELVYVVRLNDNGSPDAYNEYVNLPPPTSPPYSLRLQFEGSSPLCRHGSLWVNIPLVDEEFQRDKYREYKLKLDFNKDVRIDIPVAVSGAFSFYFTYRHVPELFGSKSDSGTGKESRSETYYVNVSPAITLKGKALPLESLSVFSLVSKFMGEYPKDWNRHLRGIGERGYNVVHFTPLVKRGASNSPYSIYDQLEFEECFSNGQKDVAEMTSNMEKEYGLLALTDVVWNHVAHNSKLLEEHPEVGYNVKNAPWLEAALELDTALLKYGDDLRNLGLPTEFKTEDDISVVLDKARANVIDKIKLWEFYTIDVERDAAAAFVSWKSGQFGDDEIGNPAEIREWSVEKKVRFLREHGITNAGRVLGRYGRKIDPKIAAALLMAMFGKYEEIKTNVSNAKVEFQKILDAVNLPLFKEFDKDVAAILDQLFGRIKYLRVDDHGPKLGPVTKDSPLIETYFTRLPPNGKHDPKSLALANNGWVWNADAMKDNAGPDSRAYLLREVIVWGDCVKLNYGASRDENPFLWDYMADYSKLMAKHFMGFRIDNCHSTPILVAEHLLDEARKVRPNLVVFAELFTGSEQTDYIFAKRLGLTGLIREAMQAWSAGELSRLVHRHGGRPIGSFEADLLSHGDHRESNQIVKQLQYTPLHALFMDCTHDNEMPAQKREARDTLPNAALVAMCSSAIGSVMGYDEIYPEHIDLVNEKRLYSSSFSEDGVKYKTGAGGIGGIKKLLNELHTCMAVGRYDETHIHHEGQFITVHRVQPNSRKGVLLIAHTAFSGSKDTHKLDPIVLSGTKAKMIGAWKLEAGAANGDANPHGEYITGLHSNVSGVEGISISEDGNNTIIRVPDDLSPGSIALLDTWLPETNLLKDLSTFITSDAEAAFESLDPVDLNFVLYKCNAEEKDISNGSDGVYDVPNFGPLVYAGLQGWWSVLEDVIRRNDVGHPICDNIRRGQWALDFIVQRMKKAASDEGYKRLSKPAEWIQGRFDAIRKLPSFLLPRYFAIVVKTAYAAALARGIRLLGVTIEHGKDIIHELAMVSIQQVGFVNSASLYPTKRIPCLAAGLPHFSTGWARCWGRDVFISLRGLLLCTGRFDEAKDHILAFGSVLKHGLIPNLLSDGKAPRYNARDAVWFYLQAIQDYTKIVPDGIKILNENVRRRFLPYDDTWFPHDDERAYRETSTVAEIIQEIFQCHASGISFREYNAGPNLDMQMKEEGFQVNVHVDWENGLVFGGNQWNCGTWMDKMGESTKSGNKGYPGTPRDGAAIEINGLLYSTLAWISTLVDQGKFPPKDVDIGSGKSITYADWTAKVKSNFERCYYIPENPADDCKYEVDSNIVHRRGIYKDLYRSGKPYEDYQFRPNFAVAMTVAPELFTLDKALRTLELADNILRGPMGMATLDPKDLNYNPYYVNSEDSTNFATAKGRNYHQGPEWLWPTGYFLRGLLKFTLMRRDSLQDRMDIFQQLTTRLEQCKKALRTSLWRGLTELTNKNGEFCADSSPTQAWSAACLIDLYYDASQLKKLEG
ncbi:glycogen debranching enzyme [Microsporum canis CBS 113480]|uniref:Glycogen debranching enzyme n=1 Tax=Arthroderma otae (strain ATCC MYA-4605 / CBS 113480) TaxID=554155 RepID=C5FS32_ARTOC|nr:glycogen debranching enzyme [Microsporum canis CBS 113480]EEQ32685.1 glycogen debranching enzyme [Microsporum canis CBS 113480]